ASVRGVAPTLSADGLEPAWFEGSTHLHLSGYSLMSSPIDGAASRAAGLVRAGGGTVSVDLASRRVIADFGAERLRSVLRELVPDLVFANEVERAEVGPDAAVAATWVLKRGAAGAEGLDVALEAERRVREEGAVPATVGVLDGQVRVGLGAHELERFSAAGDSAHKAGPRDLAVCVATGVLGATTVGGTLAACSA